MPKDTPERHPPADEPGNPIQRPLSPEVAAYWLAAVIESAEDAIITKTLEGVITSWNPGAQKLFGYTAGEVIGKSVTVLIPDDHLDEEPAILARIRAGERVEHYETVRRRKDGRLLDISLTVSPIRKPDGTIIGASKIARDITGQRGAQETLQAQAAVIAQAYDAIFLRDSSNRITLWNRGAERTYGYTPEEALGRSPHELLQTVPPVPLEEIYESLRREGYWEGELLHTRKDGGQIVVETRWATVRDARGQTTSILEITRDITERKRAEAELSQSRAQLQTVFENATVGLFVMDERQHCIYMNPAAKKLTGYTLEEVQGRPLHYFIHHARPDGTPYPLEECPIDKAFPQNNQEQGEDVFVHKDGRFYPVSFTASPLRENGHPVGTVIEVRDTTEEKRAAAEREHLLRLEQEAREEAETLYRLGQVLSAELDLHKLVQAVTDAATELTGAHFGSFFYNVLNEEGASYMLYTMSGVPREAFAHFPMPRATDLFGPTFRGDGTILIGDVKLDPRFGKNSPYYGMPEGHLPVTSYLAVPVTSRSGEVYGGLFFGHPRADVFTGRAARIVEGLAAQAAVAMDNARLFEAAGRARAHAEASAAEKERLYREAREASRLKDEFLATVSHELRTPLTAILGWAHMLRTGQFDGKSVASAFETIERNARAQSQLIDDLLDVSRIITGKLRIDVRPIDPNSFIDAAVEAVRPAAEAKGVRLQRVLDTGVVSVSGDPVRLQQVVWNLLSNAIKFTPRGGRVQVRLERVNSHVEITVSDTGAGISPEFLPHVFDRFRQADQKTTRRHGGLGLGLSIVRHLVELHGGTVRAESGGEGQGSTFTVLLPVAPINPAEPPETRVHPAARDTLPAFECPDRLDGLRVLIVDDEPDTRDMLKAGLAQCGAVVTTAGSAAEAIAEIQGAPPDVLISDIGMPEEDGYDLIRKVRALPPEGGGRVPAIALTAYARAEDRMHALRVGYQMHVPKPVELAELAAVVASIAKRDG